MISFDELSRALETYRRRRQVEGDLEGTSEPPPRAGATPPQSFQAVPEENTNELDVEDVIEE